MKRLKILYTSDIHGQLYPEHQSGSLLQCIGEFEKDSNTLIIDGGDSLQGSPLLQVMADDGDLGQTLAHCYNFGKYDYFTLGNHDFDRGYNTLASYLHAMQATCLVANVRDIDGTLPILPYEVRIMGNGLRVGLVGATTDFIQVFHSEETLAPFQIHDCYTALAKCKKALDKEQCDITICIYHGGFEEDLDTGELLLTSKENLGGLICRGLDFDILLTAHQHTPIEGRYYHGTYVMQLPSQGQQYGVVTVEVVRPMSTIHSELRTPSVYLPLPLVEYLLPIKEKTDIWVKESLCVLPQPLITSMDKIKQARFGNELANLINHVQLLATGADISCTSLPNKPLLLPETLKVDDVLRCFPHANELFVLEITGKILYEALCRSASYFSLTPDGFTVHSSFLKPKQAHYHYDFFAYVEYTITCHPEGNTVSDVFLCDAPLDMDKTYTIAMSEYRASGAGGYTFYSQFTPVARCSKNIQTLLLEFFKNKMPQDIPNYHQVHFTPFTYAEETLF